MVSSSISSWKRMTAGASATLGTLLKSNSSLDTAGQSARPNAVLRDVGSISVSAGRTAMHYDHVAIQDSEIPKAKSANFQHLLDTYSSETNKVVSTWFEFRVLNLDFKPHPKSTTVRDVMKHQLL